MKLIKILLISTLSLLTLTAYAKNSGDSSSSTTNGSDISGNYECQGYDPFGKSNYNNPVTVTKRGEVFNFQWLNSKFNPFLLGTGVMNPEVNNMVSVVFWDPKKQNILAQKCLLSNQMAQCLRPGQFREKTKWEQKLAKK